MRHLTKSIPFAALAVVLCLAWAGDAAAQDSCSFNQNATPGLAYPVMDWRVINNGILPQVYSWTATEDVVDIRVEDGNSIGLAMNEMQITLVINMDQHWQKEIVGWNQRDGYMWSTSIATPPPGFNEGVIIPPGGLGIFRVSGRITNTTNCSSWGAPPMTIIFRKAKVWGLLTTVYNMDINNFWALWGGKRVTFTWVADRGINTPYFPFCTSCVPLGTGAKGVVADRVVVSTGEWLFDAGGRPVHRFFSSGELGDIPVPGDYDGDKLRDIGFWRPRDGMWRMINSSTGRETMFPWRWGDPGDIPVPADYDGDGRTDFAVWRPRTGEWWIVNSSRGDINTVGWAAVTVPVPVWGQSGDIPVPGDYDGDGKTDLAFWRPSDGKWRVINSSTGSQTTSPQWGYPGDVPVPADYDGDGRTDFAVWRPGTGEWWIINSSRGDINVVGWAAVTRQVWGASGDIPVPGDYDHDGRIDFAIWRPSDGTWRVILSTTGDYHGPRQWGMSFEVPIKPDLKFR